MNGPKWTIFASSKLGLLPKHLGTTPYHRLCLDLNNNLFSSYEVRYKPLSFRILPHDCFCCIISDALLLSIDISLKVLHTTLEVLKKCPY